MGSPGGGPTDGGSDGVEVDVSALFFKENRVRPFSFRLGGVGYRIAKVLDESRGGTLKSRGVGVRYKVSAYGGEDGPPRGFSLFRIGDAWLLSDMGGRPDTAREAAERYLGAHGFWRGAIDGRYRNLYKAAVDVSADFKAGGASVVPRSIRWEDGRRFKVDRVLGQERSASLRAGIIGLRYTVCVFGREAFLYRDDDLWFMERRAMAGVAAKVLDVHGAAMV